jgi:hypothetical protein
MLQKDPSQNNHKCKVYLKMSYTVCDRYVIVCTLHTVSNNTQYYLSVFV